MAVFGIGAYYDDEDVSSDFVNKECACIGYDKTDASSLYEMLRRIKKGDIIYIKSYNIKTKTVLIKAIGYVIGRNIEKFKFPNDKDPMGYGRKVLWKNVFEENGDWIRVPLADEDQKNNVYNNTLYEEYSDTVINKILELL
jgi:hypothetical protein